MENKAYNELMKLNKRQKQIKEGNIIEELEKEVIEREKARKIFDPSPYYSGSILEWRKMMQKEYPNEAKNYIINEIDEALRKLILNLADDEDLIFCIVPEISWDINHDNCFALIVKSENPGSPKSKRVKVYKEVMPVAVENSTDRKIEESFTVKRDEIEYLKYLKNNYLKGDY